MIIKMKTHFPCVQDMHSYDRYFAFTATVYRHVLSTA